MNLAIGTEKLQFGTAECMEFYYLYEIKNNLNGKIYVGVHKTQNLDDGYFGSGTLIKKSIKKYGIDNFTKTIIQFADSYEELLSIEKEYVNDVFLARDDVYNLRRGGNGGFGKHHYNLARKVIKEKVQSRISKYKECPNLCKCCGVPLEYEKRRNTFCSKSCSVKYNNYSRIRNEETNRKCSESLCGRLKTEDHKKAISDGRKKGILKRHELM